MDQNAPSNPAQPEKPLALAVKEKILSAGDDLALVTPQGTDAHRLLHVIAGVIVRNPKLVQCTIGSLMSCAKDCMSLGLEPNTHHGHAYLIPRWAREINGSAATLQIGYKGYAYLMWKSGRVRMLGAGIVHEAELPEFRIELGTHGEVRHRPAPKNRGVPVGVYAWVDLIDGGTAVDWMPIEEVEGIMRRSEGYQAAEAGKSKPSPWHTDFGEMAKKTVFKRLQKLLQMPGLVARAVEIDNRNDPVAEIQELPQRRVRASFGDAEPKPLPPARDEAQEPDEVLSADEITSLIQRESEAAPVARKTTNPQPAQADDAEWEMGL